MFSVCFVDSSIIILPSDEWPLNLHQYGPLSFEGMTTDLEIFKIRYEDLSHKIEELTVTPDRFPNSKSWKVVFWFPVRDKIDLLDLISWIVSAQISLSLTKHVNAISVTPSCICKLITAIEILVVAETKKKGFIMLSYKRFKKEATVLTIANVAKSSA